MKILALALALAFGLATPGFAAERGHDGIGVGGHLDRGGVGVGVHVGGARMGVGIGEDNSPIPRDRMRREHRFHRGYHGGFIGGQYGGPYYGDPCWNWVPVFGWVYTCD